MFDFFISTAEDKYANTSFNEWSGLTPPVVILPDSIVYENASIRYYFTLTGDGDGLEDIEIPISSFQCRKRSGSESYLSVVIPDISCIADISDRSNGDLKIEKSWWYNDTNYFRTELALVNFETLRYDKGADNESITLTGHKTKTYNSNVVSVSEKPSYISQTNGVSLYRLPVVLTGINPGDTVNFDSGSFVIDTISIFVSDSVQTMELAE